MHTTTRCLRGAVKLRPGAAVPPRGAGALIGPDGRVVRCELDAHRCCSFRGGVPNCLWERYRRRANHVHAAAGKKKVPKGYMALELFFVSARTNKTKKALLYLTVTAACCSLIGVS
jgi:hypothetical protein